jgi:hypothetical protein
MTHCERPDRTKTSVRIPNDDFRDLQACLDENTTQNDWIIGAIKERLARERNGGDGELQVPSPEVTADLGDGLSNWRDEYEEHSEDVRLQAVTVADEKPGAWLRAIAAEVDTGTVPKALEHILTQARQCWDLNKGRIPLASPVDAGQRGMGTYGHSMSPPRIEVPQDGGARWNPEAVTADLAVIFDWINKWGASEGDKQVARQWCRRIDRVRASFLPDGAMTLELPGAGPKGGNWRTELKVKNDGPVSPDNIADGTVSKGLSAYVGAMAQKVGLTW